MEQGDGYSLEHTPTWAVSIVYLCLAAVSLIADAALHHLTKFLRKRKRKSLTGALEKIKTEMMIMGFISLLLTISEAPISKICLTEAVANSFHPCKDPMESSKPNVSSATQNSGSKSSTMLSDNATDGSYCEAKGMVSLMSIAGVMQLKIFISIFAVFHVFYCILIMFIGMAKMKRWKAWEEETRSLEYQIANDPTRFRLKRQTSFGQRHLKLWRHHPLLLWPVCFIRQFSGSASKADYFTLRNGFIVANVAEGSTFNFHKFLSRAFDDDFQQVVEIRFWIWMFPILFIFFSAQAFYNYYWLPFIPLLLLLAVGTKLEIIITKMCVESCKNSAVTRGAFHVKPSNDLFWFSRPILLLHLLQLILIQNSFQLAFFTWAWYEYGLRSCFNQETADIAIRITMGVGVQFLCGYVTLPIYALVAQMGSSMKRVVFTERVTKGLKNWQHKARHNLSNNISSTSIGQTSNSQPTGANGTSIAGNDNPPGHSRLPPIAVVAPPSMEATEDAEHHSSTSTPSAAVTGISNLQNTKDGAGPMAVTTGSYDGEISFGSSWKTPESGMVNQEISSIAEENAADVLADFDKQHITSL